LSFNIAVAGKGGSGKTSVASLIIRYLMKNGLRPILAIDADPNANLGESLGLTVEQTVGLVLDAFHCHTNPFHTNISHRFADI